MRTTGFSFSASHSVLTSVLFFLTDGGNKNKEIMAQELNRKPDYAYLDNIQTSVSGFSVTYIHFLF